MKLKSKLILNYSAASLLTIILVGIAVLIGIQRLSIRTIEKQLIDQSNLAEIYITQMHALKDSSHGQLSSQTAVDVIEKLGLILGHVRIYDPDLLLQASSRSDRTTKLAGSENMAVLKASQNGDYAYITNGSTIYFASPVQLGESNLCILEIISSTSFFQNLISGVLAILLVGVLFFVAIMTLLSTSIAERLTRPINRLAEAADHYAVRDFTPVDVKGSIEISRLAGSFNAMGTQLQEYIQRQKQFVSNVTHELRTPLTAIIGYSEILSGEVAGKPDLEKAVYHLNNESKRLGRLVDEVLTVSRIESGRETFVFDRVNLSFLVCNTIEIMQPRAEKYGISMESKIAPEIILMGDGEKLVQVLVNLLDNSFKFSPKGTTVKIVLHNDANYAKLEVLDDGIGIPEGDAGKVFDRFYRSENARSISGTGLGLSIVKYILEAHKGTIELKPRVEGGTIASIRLPRR